MKLYCKFISLGLLLTNTSFVYSSMSNGANNNTFADATLAQILEKLDAQDVKIQTLEKENKALNQANNIFSKRMDILERYNSKKQFQDFNDVPLSIANMKDDIAGFKKAQSGFSSCSIDKNFLYVSFKQALDENRKDQLGRKKKIADFGCYTWLTETQKAALTSLKKELEVLQQNEISLLSKMSNV